MGNGILVCGNWGISYWGIGDWLLVNWESGKLRLNMIEF